MTDVIDVPKGINVDWQNDYVHFVVGFYGWSGLIIKSFMTLLSVLAWVKFFEVLLETYSVQQTWIYLLPLFHFVLALIITYVTFSYWKNKTHIFLSQETLEVYQAPMWMPGHKRINVKEIEQVYVRHNKRARNPTTELRLKLNNRLDLKLLRIVYPLEHALYLEQAIERYIGIKNRAVCGEYEK